MKLKQVCSLYSDYGLNIAADEYVDEGVPLIRTSDFDDLGHLTLDNTKRVLRAAVGNKMLRSGDMLFSRAGTIGRCTVFEFDCEATFAAYLVRFRPDASRIEPRYIRWWAQSQHYWDQIRTEAIESTIGNFNAAKFSNLRIPTLAREAQIGVADFLERETARIDQLIEKKKRLMERLQAKQETVRDIATCKGLDPDVLYKNSGVDWFGDVPAHWLVCRFNRLIASKVDYRGRTPEKVDKGIFLVTARNIRAGKIDYERSQEFTTVQDWEKLSARGKPEIGDVVFTTEAPLGQIAQVDRLDVAFAQRIMKFRANERFVSNDFLTQFMMSASFQRSLQLYASGSTASGIKSERMAHLFGLVPPASEQSKIVEHVRSEIERLKIVVAPIEESIDRLREFRAALITSAVIGQIEVATWQKRGATDRRLAEIQEPMRA